MRLTSLIRSIDQRLHSIMVCRESRDQAGGAEESEYSDRKVFKVHCKLFNVLLEMCCYQVVTLVQIFLSARGAIYTKLEVIFRIEIFLLRGEKVDLLLL